MDTDSLYLESSVENLDNCILPEKKAQENNFVEMVAKMTLYARKNFYPRSCCVVPKTQD